MASRTCLSPESLSRAFPDGADEDLRAHLTACERCAEVWRQLEALTRLGKALPWSLPERERHEELRMRLVLEADRLMQRPRHPAPRRSAWGRAVVSCMVAAALLVCVLGARSLLIRRSAEPGAGDWRATVLPLDGARFTHRATLRDEVVRLMDGTVRIEVQPLRPGERFRVLVGASEIEVKGTVFEATAQGGVLQGVYVRHGLVAVRRQGAPEIYLAAGQRWPIEPPAPAALAPSPAAAAPAPAAAPPSGNKSASEEAPSLVRLPRRERTLRPSGTQEQSEAAPDTEARQRLIDAAFGEGFAALRRKQFSEAAVAFGRAATAAGQRPIAEDAWYWRAVSLGRAGNSGQAMHALQEFLSRYPRSARYTEVSCMLGWFLFKADRIDEAAARFQAAGKDRSAEVRESARLGLAAVRGSAKTQPPPQPPPPPQGGPRGATW